MSLTTPSTSPIAWPAFALLCFGGLLVLPTSAQEQPLRTEAERSGFTRHTDYEQMMTYLRDLRAQSPEMRLGSYGRSHDGRELPYVVLSRPAITHPREAAALGKPVVLLAAGVHGGERTLRESLLILLRELAEPGSDANRLLDDVVVLVAPMLNPDGFEASRWGRRINSGGVDLNRDYIKLEQPETTHYVRDLLHRWSPHLFIDGHDGGSYPYHLNYQCPSIAGADPGITLLCDEEIFPAVDAGLEAHGYRSWFYAWGNDSRWEGGGFDARIGRNYGGLAGMVAILFESPPWQRMEGGVKSGILGIRAVVEWVRDNPERLVDTVERARRETVALGSGTSAPDIAVQMEYGPEEYSVTYALAEGEGSEVRLVTSDSLMKRPIATRTRPRPHAYLLPPEAVEAVAMLRRHGILVEVLQENVWVSVNAYTIARVRYERADDHERAARVHLAETVTLEQDFPEGTFVIPMAQVLGRIAAHMLEPETNDNVVYWNTMDEWLPERGQSSGNAVLPIYKLLDPRGLPTRVLEDSGPE